MPQSSARERRAHRFQRARAAKANAAHAKWRGAADPIFWPCPTCGASPRNGCRASVAPALDRNYHPARHGATKAEARRPTGYGSRPPRPL